MFLLEYDYGRASCKEKFKKRLKTLKKTFLDSRQVSFAWFVVSFQIFLCSLHSPNSDQFFWMCYWSFLSSKPILRCPILNSDWDRKFKTTKYFYFHIFGKDPHTDDIMHIQNCSLNVLLEYFQTKWNVSKIPLRQKYSETETLWQKIFW